MPCPDKDCLRDLLDNNLAETRLHEVTSHLDDCSCCQEALEGLVEAPKLVEAVRGAEEARPAAGSAYWHAIARVEEEVRENHAQNTTRTRAAIASKSDTGREAGDDVPLDFLTPSNEPGSLGSLERFEVRRVIGRGGMGIVLHAFDSWLERDVAVKVLDPTLARDETARKRFCRESRAAASVTHENVVSVHHVEEDGPSGLPYLVMQLIDGESLDDRLGRGVKMSLESILRIGAQAASGLAAAHDKGLVHRDVKPANILIDRINDRVKLTDFGLARAAEDARLTSTGMVAGTPLYMAPEQARGEEVDQRSDIFSLGVVLYELCTGKTPFDAPTPLAVLRRITDEKHRPILELAPETPIWLADLIDEMLDKKPDRRPQTALEVVHTLDQHWVALRSSSQVLMCPYRRRRQKIVNISVAAVAGFVVGLLTMWLALPRGATPPREAGPAFPALTASATLKGNPGTVWSVDFSRDDGRLLAAIEDGEVRQWDVAAQKLDFSMKVHRGAVWTVARSPDGEWTATAGDDGDVVLIPKGSRSLERKLPLGGATIRGLAYSPDGKRLLTGDRQGHIRLWNLDTDSEVRSFSLDGAVYALAFADGGKVVVATGSDKVIRLWDTDTGMERFRFNGHTGPVYGLDVSPDGKTLASASWDQTIRLWDLNGGSEIRKLEGHAGDVWSVSFSPDGKLLASAGQDGTVRLWRVETGETLAVGRGHTGTVHCVAFAHDGKSFASGARDGTVRVWDVTAWAGK